MALEWYCESGEPNSAPLTFQDLQRMVVEGTVTAKTRVRRGAGDWVRADTVLGLFAISASAETPTAPLQTNQKIAAVADVRTPRRRRSRRAALTMAAAFLAMAGAVYFAGGRAIRFPRPRGDAVAVPGPAAPPALVAGLERTAAAYSPCLSADLTTIVFADMRGTMLYDLFLATRRAADEPFGAPSLIAPSATRDSDIFPSLTPDGLELVYLSADVGDAAKSPKLLRCARPAVGAPFSLPVELQLGSLDTKQVRAWCPQLIDDRRLRLSTIPDTGSPQVLIATRTDRTSEFSTPEPVAMADHYPMWCFSEDGRRAYAGTENGIYRSSRSSQRDTFGTPVLLFPASAVGPVDGPLWVTPKQDMIYYCSPGPGEKAQSARRLWVLRL